MELHYSKFPLPENASTQFKIFFSSKWIKKKILKIFGDIPEIYIPFIETLDGFNHINELFYYQINNPVSLVKYIVYTV